MVLCFRTGLPDPENFSKFKTSPNLVSWIVSHCQTPSKRAEYIRELNKFIDIDIHGFCKDGNTAKTPRCNIECYRGVLRDSKFYLAFENAFCEDYFSEKVSLRYRPNAVRTYIMHYVGVRGIYLFSFICLVISSQFQWCMVQPITKRVFLPIPTLMPWILSPPRSWRST